MTGSRYLHVNFRCIRRGQTRRAPFITEQYHLFRFPDSFTGRRRRSQGLRPPPPGKQLVLHRACLRDACYGNFITGLCAIVTFSFVTITYSNFHVRGGFCKWFYIIANLHVHKRKLSEYLSHSQGSCKGKP